MACGDSSSGGIGIYVHLPFCRRRCSYCPFAISVDLRLEASYFDALVREVDAAPRLPGRVDTVYFGGGTPSLSRNANLERLVSSLRRFDVVGAREWTLEGNPEDVDETSLASWRDLGITRVSIGVQSLHDRELRPIGRLHGREKALEATQLAVRSGARTNVDLIIGLPGQTRESFRESLLPLLDLGVGHISLYILDLDEDTPLGRRVEAGRVQIPEEDGVVEQYEEAIEVCSLHGLAQYEISNFARTGEESLHNLRYWNREPYLGFGLGAHSFSNERRWANSREINEYISAIESGASPVIFTEELNDEERREELIFLALRQRKGVPVATLRELSPDRAESWFDRGIAEGWLRTENGSVGFTSRGFLLSNELIAELF